MSKEPDQHRRDRLERLAALPDDLIDTADIPEVRDWSGAVRGGLYKPRKEAITIRLDADILAFFRGSGGRYQSEINRALREWVRDHRPPQGATR